MRKDCRCLTWFTFEFQNVHTLGIEIFGSYVQIYDGLQGYLSELPDFQTNNHTIDLRFLGQPMQIADV